LSLLERPEHHKRIDIVSARTSKGEGQAAHDLETEGLPKAHGALVRADDKVELHGAETAIPSMCRRMLTHAPSDASALGGGMGHVATVSHMASAAQLIGRI
jgi:hypothetical protein